MPSLPCLTDMNLLFGDIGLLGFATPIAMAMVAVFIAVTFVAFTVVDE